MVDSRYANALPADGGYLALQNGAASCLANDPFNSCHDVHYIHESDVKPLDSPTSCDTESCHTGFVPVLAKALGDNISPEAPR